MEATITRPTDISTPAPVITRGHPDFERLNERMGNLHRDYPSTWGAARYKKQTDPETGQKCDMGNGCAVHPSKKKRMKQTAEGVATIRPSGADLVPVPEARLLVIPSEDMIPGQMKVPTLDYTERKKASDRGILAEVTAGIEARRRISIEHNARVVTEYKEAHKIRTDTAESAYKTFRFSALDLIQSVKHSGITPAAFYREYGEVLRSLAREACQKCGVEFEEFRAFTRANTPKMAHVFGEKPETGDTPPSGSGGPSEATVASLAELQKKLERAIKRRDKAQREIDELDLQITAMLSSKSAEEVREVFYPTPEPTPGTSTPWQRQAAIINGVSERAKIPAPTPEQEAEWARLRGDTDGAPTPAQDEPERSLRATRRRERVERQRAKRARESRRSEQQQAA